MTFRRHFIALVMSLVAGLAVQPAVADHLPRIGTFEGVNEYLAKGQVELVLHDGVVRVQFHDDFWFDGGPEPIVGLGNGEYDPSTLMGPLQLNYGEQVYDLPEGIDANDYSEVWIWSAKYDIPMAVAVLSEEE